MKALDWKGKIIREYKDVRGNRMFDMQWDISTGMTIDDVSEEDLIKWAKRKKDKEKRKKMKKGKNKEKGATNSGK